MNRNTATIATLFLLLVLAPSSALAKKARASEGASDADASAPRLVRRLHSVYYLDLREAGLSIEQRVPEMLDNPDYELRYEGIGGSSPGEAKPKGYLRVLTTAEYQDRIAGVLEQLDQPPKTRVFHIIVLGASDEPAAAPEPSELPAGAEAAYREIKSFLPFRSYRMIDSALVRSSGRADVSLSQSYAIEFAFRVGPSKDKPLEVQQFLLYSKGYERAPRHMETSFSMDIGETVVVGTSRPFRDEEGAALIVLMTALE